MPLTLQQTVGANRDRRAPSAPAGGLAWRRGLVTAFMQIQPRRGHLAPVISRLLPDNMGHDAPRHRVVDCVDAQDCSSTPIRVTSASLPLFVERGSQIQSAEIDNQERAQSALAQSRGARVDAKPIVWVAETAGV